MSTIANGADTPLNALAGSVPDVSGAMQDYFQPMTFTPVSKAVEGFQVVETPTPIVFRGVIQPFTERQLMLKPEGERSWTWLMVHADPSLTLNTDDVMLYLGKQTRVMARKNYRIYGYVEYHVIQDYTGSGP